MLSDRAEKRPSLLIATDCSYHGTFNVAKMIATGLRHDFRVSLAVPADTDLAGTLAELELLGIRTIQTAANFEQLERSAYDRVEAARILDYAQPDILLCCDGAQLFSLLALKDVALGLGIPFLMIVNILPENAFRHFANFEDRARQLLARAAHLVFVSQALCTRFQAMVDVPVPKQVIPNFCRDEFFRDRDVSARRRIRQELGIPSDATVFCTVGRIDKNKGQHLSLAALREVRERGCACYWLYIGRIEVWEKEGFESALAASGARDVVRILGERSDICDLLDASDVLVLTSSNEGMPLVVIEGLARGLPVFATAVDGVVEQIDENCGILLPSPVECETKTIDALATAMERVLRDPESLVSMSAAARKRGEDFRSTNAIASYKAAIMDVASRAPRQNSRLLPAPAVASSEGRILDFTKPAVAWNVLGDGWTSCTSDGVFSQGKTSEIRLHFLPSRSRVRLDLRTGSHDWASSVEADLFVGAHFAGRMKIGKRERSISLDLDLERAGPDASLRFIFPRVNSFGRAIRLRELYVRPSKPSIKQRIGMLLGRADRTSPAE